VQRISVVGITGSGKTKIARELSRILDLPHYDLDMYYWLPRWKPRERAEFDALVERIAAGERWVVDGSYEEWTVNGPIWKRADTVVWPRLSLPATMRQLAERTANRLARGVVLENGNREELRKLLNPTDSIFTDVVWRFRSYNAAFERHCRDPRFSDKTFVVLRNREQVNEWLGSVAAQHAP
jgi:adenylate kinase family enzyme